MYPIKTDFRAGVAFELMIQNGEEDAEKLLSPFFCNGFPVADVEDIFHAVTEFYCCGKPTTKKEKPTSDKQAYSFQVDASALFADFWNFYQVDLSRDSLHWWAFRSLMEGLPEKSEFKQRVYYRTCSLKGLSKKERERVLKIRASIEIKKPEKVKQTLEDRNAQMLAYVASRRKDIKGGGDNG